jgi:hypothetical protein
MNGERGFTSITAPRKLLRKLGFQIDIIFDKRRIKAYLISKNDWYELERYLTDGNLILYKQSPFNKPVLAKTTDLMEDLISIGWRFKNGNPNT